jgi:hypothetical protein
MAEVSVAVKRESLYQLLRYATQHPHSRFWIPALDVISARVGVTLHA